MTRYDPRGAACLRLGRFDPKEKACELWWSGSGVRTRLDGRRLELEATTWDDDHTAFVCVAVDGAPVTRFALRPGTHRYDLLGGMEAGVPHEVEIVRDTQPVDCDATRVVFDALWADGTLTAPAPRPRLIEFIGDSLTVGEGTVGPRDAMDWRMLWISNRFAFPELVSDALDADKRVVALGGWGAYLSYDANPGHALGHIYDKLCGIVPAANVDYDFAAQRRADAVVINLGTNDGGAIDRMEGPERDAALAALEESAARLLADVRAHNPGAPILWAYGMCGDGVAAPLRRAVERRVAAGDATVRYLALDDCAGDVGSRMHPSRSAHRRAAEQIAGALEKMLKRNEKLGMRN